MMSDRNDSGLGRMNVVSMRSDLPQQTPPVLLDYLDDISVFHRCAADLRREDARIHHTGERYNEANVPWRYGTQRALTISDRR